MSVKSWAGYYTVTYTNGACSFDYWNAFVGHVSDTHPYSTNESGWGYIMSTGHCNPNTSAYSNNSGTIQATFHYHQTNYWDGTPPSSVNIRLIVNLQSSARYENISLSYDTDLVDPDYISDGSTSSGVNVLAYKDYTITSPGYQFSVTCSPSLYTSCSMGDHSDGGIYTNLQFIASTI